MIVDVRERLERAPFVPFVVRTSDGHDYSVPTVDHAYITPKGNRVIVVADDGAVAVLGLVHISGIIDQPTPA
jgi:outer membrane lipoprotein SlyB